MVEIITINDDGYKEANVTHFNLSFLPKWVIEIHHKSKMDTYNHPICTRRHQQMDPRYHQDRQRPRLSSLQVRDYQEMWNSLLKLMPMLLQHCQLLPIFELKCTNSFQVQLFKLPSRSRRTRYVLFQVHFLLTCQSTLSLRLKFYVNYITLTVNRQFWIYWIFLNMSRFSGLFGI